MVDPDAPPPEAAEEELLEEAALVEDADRAVVLPEGADEADRMEAGVDAVVVERDEIDPDRSAGDAEQAARHET